MTEAEHGATSGWRKVAAWSLIAVLGFGAFALALLATMPAQVLVDAMGVRVPLSGLSGTVWKGQGQMAGNHLATWSLAGRDSLLTASAVYDVTLAGPQTQLVARVSFRPAEVAVGPLSGQAGWPLLAAVMPGLQIACDGVADLQVETIVLAADDRSAAGRVTAAPTFCDRVDGTVTRVPVPALVADITTVGAGIEAVVTGDAVPLVTALVTPDDRALITIHAAGAAMVPGMPASADSQIDIPLDLLR